MLKSIIYLIIFGFVAIAEAQWSNDPSENLQVFYGGVGPIPCGDGNGGAFITFSRYYGEGLNTHLYMQRVDRYGYVKWDDPVYVGGDGDADGGIPGIMEDGFKGAIIGFADCTAIDTIEHYVFYKCKTRVQRIDSSGNKLWGDYGLEVSVDTASHILLWNVVPDGEGGAIVSYTSRETYNSDTTSMFIQHISHDGNRLWGDYGIELAESVEIFNPIGSMVSDGSGGVIILYYPEGEIKFQRIDSDGNSVWTAERYCTKMIGDGNGGVVLGTNYYLDYQYRRITVNWLLPNGNFLWGEEGIIVEDSLVWNLAGLSDIALRPDSVIVVSWGKREEPGGRKYILTQMINYDGEFLFPEGSIPVSQCDSIKSSGNIILSDNNSVIYRFKVYRPDYSYHYLQKLDANGNQLWDNDVLITDKEIYSHTTISDKNGGIIFIFNPRVPLAGIWAQQISRDGNLGEVMPWLNVTPEYNLPGKYQLFQNYPNPFNPITTITYDLPEISAVQLTIYDLLGREVVELVNDVKVGGIHNSIWNSTDNLGKPVSSGLYIYRMSAVSKESDKRFVKNHKMLLLK